MKIRSYSYNQIAHFYNSLFYTSAVACYFILIYTLFLSSFLQLLLYLQLSVPPSAYWFTFSLLVHLQLIGSPSAYWFTFSLLVHLQLSDACVTMSETEAHPLDPPSDFSCIQQCSRDLDKEMQNVMGKNLGNAFGQPYLTVIFVDSHIRGRSLNRPDALTYPTKFV